MSRRRSTLDFEIPHVSHLGRSKPRSADHKVLTQCSRQEGRISHTSYFSEYAGLSRERRNVSAHSQNPSLPTAGPPAVFPIPHTIRCRHVRVREGVGAAGFGGLSGTTCARCSDPVWESRKRLHMPRRGTTKRKSAVVLVWGASRQKKNHQTISSCKEFWNSTNQFQTYFNNLEETCASSVRENGFMHLLIIKHTQHCHELWIWAENVDRSCTK